VDFPADGSGPCLVAVAKQNQFQLEWPPGEILLGPGRSILRNPRVRGSQVAFLQSTPASFAEGEIRVMAKGGQPRPLARCKGFTALAWGPGGDEIWFSTFDGGESRIQAVTLQGRTRILARYPGRLELLDVDPSGRCLAISSSQLRQAFGRAPGAGQDMDLTWLDAQTPQALLPDGNQVLLGRSGDWEMSDRVSLYLRPLAGGPAVNLGTGSLAADLSPDVWLSSTSRNFCACTRSGSPRRTARCVRWSSGCSGPSSPVGSSIAVSPAPGVGRAA